MGEIQPKLSRTNSRRFSFIHKAGLNIGGILPSAQKNWVVFEEITLARRKSKYENTAWEWEQGQTEGTE